MTTPVQFGRKSNSNDWVFANDVNELQIGLEELFVNVKRYGAVGDGVADDTVQIQAAINAALTGTNPATAIARVFFPAGDYKITSALTIPFCTGLEISGVSQSTSRIIQATNNTPILSFTTNPYSHHIRVHDLFLGYQNQQTSSHTNSACILLGGSAGAQPYNLLFERLYLYKGFRGIYAKTSAGSAIPWGLFLRDISASWFTGSVLMSTDSSGKPNCGVENIYISNTGGGPTATESAIRMSAAEMTLRNLDIEGWNFRHLQLDASDTPVIIDGYHMENSTFPDNVWDINYIANSGFYARGISAAFTVNQTYNKIEVFVADGNSGVVASVDGMIVKANNIGVGKVYPIRSINGAEVYLRGIVGTGLTNDSVDPAVATSVAAVRSVDGDPRPAISTKTANYTATVNDGTLLVDASAGAVTILLPAAAACTGKCLTIKRTSASNNVIADGNASETIDGATTKTITTQYGFLTLVSDGTGWDIVATGGTIT